jgi:hypothetical protein
MAIELPGVVADFLGFLGINWPNINEDKVKEFGEHVAQFGQEMQSNHESATQTIQQLGQAYQGQSYEVLLAKWGEMSQSHMQELVTGCQVVSAACDVGYGVIVGMKVEALAQLVEMAITWIEAQAAAVETLGASEAIAAAMEEAGQQLMKFLESELENYIIGQIINAAFEPLIEKVESAVQGLVYKEVASALGVSGGAGDSVQIVPSQAKSLADQIGGYGESLLQTAQSFTSTVEGMTFE